MNDLHYFNKGTSALSHDNGFLNVGCLSIFCVCRGSSLVTGDGFGFAYRLSDRRQRNVAGGVQGNRAARRAGSALLGRCDFGHTNGRAWPFSGHRPWSIALNPVKTIVVPRCFSGYQKVEFRNAGSPSVGVGFSGIDDGAFSLFLLADFDLQELCIDGGAQSDRVDPAAGEELCLLFLDQGGRLGSFCEESLDLLFRFCVGAR